MSGLWRNECFKIYRQTANRVIVIIALVLALLTPVFQMFVSGALDLFEQDDTGEYWEEIAANDLEEGYYIDYCDVTSRISASDFFEEISVAKGNWKYQAFYEKYRTLLYRKSAFEFYLDGKIEKQEFADAFYWDYTYGSDDLFGLGNEYPGRVYDASPDTEQTSLEWLESFDAQSELNRLRTDIRDIETTLKNLTVKDYANMQLAVSRTDLNDKKSALGETRTKAQKGEATQSDVLKAELEVEGAEYIVSFYEHMAKTNVPEDKSDWLVRTAVVVGSQACSELTSVPDSEDEFYANAMGAIQYGTDDYAKYCESVEKARTNARRALMTADYAIENGVEIPEMTAHSAKLLARNSFTSIASIVIIAMIIITANNIALEYSSGTIRLLLIRPRKRTKIIFSKFLALFTTGVILSVAVFIVIVAVSTILNGAIYGEWDTFTPDLLCFSRVIRINGIFYSFAKLFLPLFSGLFQIALAFMMAVVTRKAALAIIAPVVVNSMSSLVQLLSMNFAGDYPILKFTILPYLDMGPYLFTPLARYAFIDGDLTSILNGGFGTVAMSSDLSAVTGAVIVLIHFVLLFGLGFFAFRKQQIKN